jgi:hypothetical protein
VTLAPISSATSTPAKWPNEPTPGCAILTFCPGVFIQRTSSAISFGGSVGRAARVEAAVLMRPMGTKSFSASNARLG